MIDLSNKRVLITGATGSIGSAISDFLNEVGAFLYLSGTDSSKLKKVNKKYGERCKTIRCDLASLSDIKNMMSMIDQIDVVVCSAGITRDNLSIRMSEQEFQEVIDVNLRGNIIINRESVKKMLRARVGNIVNISSVVGLSGNVGQSNYAASKAGLIVMSKSIALEVAHTGININVVAPGFIESTEKLSNVYKENILSKILKRRFDVAKDVAHMIAFFVSPLSSYITGQTFHVNGGMLML